MINEQYPHFTAREIANIPLEKLWDMPDEDVQVTFDDNVTAWMSWRSVIASAYLWDIQRDFPEVPITSKHAILNENWKRSTPNTILTNILKTIDVYAHWMQKEYIMKTLMLIFNQYHNTFISRTQEYVTSVNALDIMRIVESPEIREVMDDIQPTHYSINKAYRRGNELLADPNWQADNPAKRPVNFGVVNGQQFNQVAFCRGFNADINSVQFDSPILTGYARGLHKLHDLAVESRSSARAVYQQKDPISTTEYFSRRLQLMNEVVRYLYPGDCGATELISVNVEGDRFKAAVGSYYLDPETNQITEIRSTDKEKIQALKVIKIRSALTCKHTPKGGICTVCYGDFEGALAKCISPGHTVAIGIGEKISTKVLSTKHLDRSIEVRKARIDGKDRDFLEVVGENGNQIRLSKRFKKREGAELFIPQESLSFLSEVSHTDNTEKIQLSRVSVVKDIAFNIKEEGQESLYPIDVTDGSRNAYFTGEFLDYILSLPDAGEIENRKYVRIRLDGWDFEKPIMELPLKRESMVDYLKKFSEILETKISKMRIDPNTTQGLSEATEVVFSTLEEFVDAPYAYVAFITSMMLIRSEKELDYRLPTEKTHRDFSQRLSLFRYRSLAQAMALERHEEAIISPMIFTDKLRPNHPFDVLLIPGIADIFEDFREDAHLPPELRDPSRLDLDL